MYAESIDSDNNVVRTSGRGGRDLGGGRQTEGIGGIYNNVNNTNKMEF